MIDLLLLVAATSAQQAVVMAPEFGVDALFPPTVSVLPVILFVRPMRGTMRSCYRVLRCSKVVRFQPIRWSSDWNLCPAA